MRALAQAAGDWADTHRGLTLLLVDAEIGPVVSARNALGGLVVPPVQREPLLHRVLPTLPAEIELRHDQLAAGLATRLDRMRPSRVDVDTLRQLAEPDAARWPDHYACWSGTRRRIVDLPAPDPAARARWVTALREASERCALAD
jgi:hypothetical protein